MNALEQLAGEMGLCVACGRIWHPEGRCPEAPVITSANNLVPIRLKSNTTAAYEPTPVLRWVEITHVGSR